MSYFFCTITPTRGDRPELLEFCKHQLQRMNIKPQKSYFIDDKPTTQKPDLTYRIRKGIEMAKRDGFDNVFIVEDDDYYSPFYFSKMYLQNRNSGPQFIGAADSVYYHLGKKGFTELVHPKRSSLFMTGLKISALEGFRWPADDEPFLDIELWKHANKKAQRFFVTTEPLKPAIGIKHGIGLCGGSGHRMKPEREDQDLEFLKRHVDPEAFDFYKTLINKL